MDQDLLVGSWPAVGEGPAGLAYESSAPDYTLVGSRVVQDGVGGEERPSGACDAITRVFALLGKRWSGLIIVTLLSGPARFSQLARGVPGLSERMLAERLAELTDAGLVEREIVDGPPVSVRYRLTTRGASLRPALDELEQWGREQLLDGSVPDGQGPVPDGHRSVGQGPPATAAMQQRTERRGVA